MADVAKVKAEVEYPVAMAEATMVEAEAELRAPRWPSTAER